MNHNDAEQALLKSKWKTTLCPQGESCWCRIIEPEEKIKYISDFDSEEEMYVVAAGCIPTKYAKHIVKLHNNSLSEQQQYIKCDKSYM